MNITYKQKRIAMHPAIFHEIPFKEFMQKLGARQINPNKYFIQKRFGQTITLFLGNIDEGDWNIYIQGKRTQSVYKKICSLINNQNLGIKLTR